MRKGGEGRALTGPLPLLADQPASLGDVHLEEPVHGRAAREDPEHLDLQEPLERDPPHLVAVTRHAPPGVFWRTSRWGP
jgi:hypothetical protein